MGTVKRFELLNLFGECLVLQAHRAEMETVGETAGRCLTVLRRIFPEVKVPAPVHAAASRWGSDKWARGSYR